MNALNLLLLSAVVAPLPSSSSPLPEDQASLPSVLILSLEDQKQLQAMAEEVERTFDREYKEGLERIEKEAVDILPKEKVSTRGRVFNHNETRFFRRMIAKIQKIFDPLGADLKNFEEN